MATTLEQLNFGLFGHRLTERDRILVILRVSDTGVFYYLDPRQFMVAANPRDTRFGRFLNAVRTPLQTCKSTLSKKVYASLHPLQTGPEYLGSWQEGRRRRDWRHGFAIEIETLPDRNSVHATQMSYPDGRPYEFIERHPVLKHILTNWDNPGGCFWVAPHPHHTPHRASTIEVESDIQAA